MSCKGWRVTLCIKKGLFLRLYLLKYCNIKWTFPIKLMRNFDIHRLTYKYAIGFFLGNYGMIWETWKEWI